MASNATLGWSLLSSGIVTLFLKLLPYDSLWWGLLLIALGAVVMYLGNDRYRR